eukprot:13734409-Alexandrium_andersonii.AAC.1
MSVHIANALQPRLPCADGRATTVPAPPQCSKLLVGRQSKCKTNGQLMPQPPQCEQTKASPRTPGPVPLTTMFGSCPQH